MRPRTGGDCAAPAGPPAPPARRQLPQLRAAHPFLTPEWSARLIRAYGTDATKILGAATSPQALGRDSGAALSEAEVRYLMTHEYARHAADVVWRRSKLGLRMTGEQVEALEEWMRGVG